MSSVVLYHLICHEGPFPGATMMAKMRFRKYPYYFKTMPTDAEILARVISLDHGIRGIDRRISSFEVFSIEITPEQAIEFVTDYLMKNEDQYVKPQTTTTLVKSKKLYE